MRVNVLCIYCIIFGSIYATKQENVSMSRCWRKHFITNCGQTVADSDLLTKDSL